MFADFMVNAWLSGTIVAVLAGAVGFFVVARGASFAAHAIPNGAFAGAAGAGLLGWNPLLGLVPFALAAAAIIGAGSRRARSDATTALTLVGMLALGSAFLAVGSNYEPSVISLLFGEVLGVSSSELGPLVVLAVAVVVALALGHRPLWYTTASPELAVTRGVRVAWVDAGFLVVLALSTALTVPVVGALLTFALMVGPPAAVQLLVTRPGLAFAGSVGASVVVVWLSIAGSYEVNWPIGFFVGVVSAALFVAALAAVALRSRVARPVSTAPA
ncbi:MAG: metal ABC transporter permease [Acidimicrobiales bacterium]